MIEPSHPNLTIPDATNTLWRFMDFSKFVDLLDSGALWLSRVDQMQDPYEAALPKLTESGYRNYFEQPGIQQTSVDSSVEGQLRGLRLMRTQYCISCWHENEFESAAMWKLYAKSDECVAIRTTVQTMLSVLDPLEELIHLARINYIDYKTEAFSGGIPTFSGFDVVTHKRRSFAHEHEVRLILWTSASANQMLAHGRPLLTADDTHLPYPAKGYALKLQLSKLIEQVYVSPNSSAWFHRLVGKILDRYELPITPIRSELYDRPLD